MSRRLLSTLLLAGGAAALLSLHAPGASAKRAAPPPPPSDVPQLNVRTFQLANGLKVILAPDPSVTSVVVHVWYHVGSKDEVAGKTGFAHLFEHLMFEGSAHVGEGQFDVLLEQAGGWNNGTTNNDRTNYFEQVPAAQLPLALWLEADRMAGLWTAMNQGVLDNQREVVKNERRQSYENAPYGEAELVIQQALWPAGHGNHNLTIGTMADLGAASLADVEAFWRAYYRPSNATLVIAGGVPEEVARELVEQYFGWMPAQPAPTTRTLTEPVTPLPARVELTTTDDVQAPKVTFAFRTEAPMQASTADLEVAAQLLGGGKTSRLYRELVVKRRLASEVSAYYNPQMLGGEFQIAAIARDGVDPAALRQAIDEQLAQLRAAAPPAAETERAKRVLRADRIQGLEDLASLAEQLATWSAYAGQADYAAAEFAALDAVTSERIQASASAWLAANAAVVMTVTPAAPAAGKEAP
jgi:zinc protease